MIISGLLGTDNYFPTALDQIRRKFTHFGAILVTNHMELEFRGQNWEECCSKQATGSGPGPPPLRWFSAVFIGNWFLKLVLGGIPKDFFLSPLCCL